MLEKLRSNRPVQLLLGLVTGVIFGFLLQRGGVTQYDVLIGQLLLTDFTVLKVILTAVIVGMVGIYGLRYQGLVELSPKPGAFGSSVVGGLIFGIGFGILGYCPGTVTGAAAQGSLDALLGGIPGLLIGSALYAAMYPYLKERVLNKGSFGPVTLPQVVQANTGAVVGAAAVLIIVALVAIEGLGF